MKPWIVLDRAPAPGGGELVLSQRDQELCIHIDGELLMSSRKHGSEAEMADAAGLGALRPEARVLVGGLGFGYTLAAVLRQVSPRAHVAVAELSSAVIDWNRGPAADLAGRPLADPRVQVRCVDVMRPLRAAADSATPPYDAILLDVDNGPWALSTLSNRGLYDRAGVLTCFHALAPGGVLVVWSAGDDDRFTRLLRDAGFAAHTMKAAARTGGKGGTHVLFVGRRPFRRL